MIHFDKFYLGTKDYQDNYDRIFRKEGKNAKKQTLRRNAKKSKVKGKESLKESQELLANR